MADFTKEEVLALANEIDALNPWSDNAWPELCEKGANVLRAYAMSAAPVAWQWPTVDGWVGADGTTEEYARSMAGPKGRVRAIYAAPPISAPAEPVAVKALAAELLDFHDALGREVGDGAFRLVLLTGLDASQMTRNLRAVLREAASALVSPPAPVAEAVVPERRGIYVASKTKHAQHWRDRRSSGAPIISTWIDEAGEGETSDFADLWTRCVSEASSAGVLIAYREPDDVLKGGWVEIGAALAVGVPVLGVGLEPFTIGKSGLIKHCANIDDAFAKAGVLLAAAPTPPAREIGEDR